VDAQRGAEYTGDTLVSSAASETRTADGAAEGARCDDGPGDGVEVSKSGKGLCITYSFAMLGRVIAAPIRPHKLAEKSPSDLGSYTNAVERRTTPRRSET
jgi:hypothetical protein